jgi:cell division septal protein FtsQ
MHERFRDRRQAVQDAGRRHRRRLLFSLVALAALAAGSAALTASPLFRVTEVRVTGAQGQRADQARIASGLAVGQHLLFADLDQAAARVEALPWVADATPRRVPPSTLEVGITVRRAVAVVRLPDSSWLVDADGVLIGGGTEQGLALIDAPGAGLPSVGRPIEDASIRAAITFHQGLPQALRARVQRYDATANAPLRMLVAPGVWVRLGDAERVAEKAQAVELVLEQAARGALDLEDHELDVRAPENPVLVPQ